MCLFASVRVALWSGGSLQGRCSLPGSHILEGEQRVKNQQLVETTFPTLQIPLCWHVEGVSNNPVHGEAVGTLLKWVVMFPSLPPLPAASLGATSASPPGSL